MIYNDSQWSIIAQAAPHYESARHEVVRNAPRWMTEQVKMVYEAATGKRIPYADTNCAVCVLRIYQIIGKTYFQDLPNHQKSEVEIETEKNETNANGDTNNNKRDAKPDSGNTKTKNGNTGKSKKGKKQK